MLFCSMAFAKNEATVFTWGIRTDLIYFTKNAYHFKSEIEKKSKGRIKINIEHYPESSEDGQVVTDWVKSNRYSISQELTGKLEARYPELKLWSLPFLFRDDQHVEKYIATIGQGVLKGMEDEYVHPVDFSFSGGFLAFTGAKLNSLKELKGKSLTIEEGYETYNKALQDRGVKLKGERNSWAQGYSEQILAVADELANRFDLNKVYINISDHRVVSRIIFVNKFLLDQLSASDRELFLDTLRKYAVAERKDSVDGKHILVKLLENRGAQFNNWNAATRKKERALFEDVYRSYESSYPGVIKKVDEL